MNFINKAVAVTVALCLIVLCVTGCGDKKREYNYGEALSYPNTAQFVSTGNEGIFSYIVFDDYVEITGCDVSEGQSEVVFPSTIENKLVKVIAGGILRGNAAVESVVIPDSVEVIGSYAFESCTSLETVVLPNGLKKLGCGVFAETEWYKSLDDEFCTVGRGVLLKYNGNNDEVTIPDYVGYIADAFSNNQFITKVVIPDTVKGISDRAFYNCFALSEVELPSALADIGAQAFDETTWLALEKADFVTVGDGVLIKYNGDAETVQIPTDVKYIAGAFYGNETVKEIIVPDSVRMVKYTSFTECSALEKVTFDGADTVLDDNLFNGCQKLSEVKLPQNIAVLPDGLFAKCLALYNIDIPQSVKYIGGSAFYYCDKLTNVVLPEGIKELGVAAFFGCSALKTVNLPDSLVRLGKTCFAVCLELQSPKIPQGVTVIEGGVFSYCSKIKNIEIPTTVTSINEYAFEGNQNITIDILGNETLIDANAFGESVDRVTLRCENNSVAAKFAQQKGIRFEIRE